MRPAKDSRRPGRASDAPPESPFLEFISRPEYPAPFWLYVSQSTFNAADDISSLICFLAFRFEFFCFLEPKLSNFLSIFGAILFLLQIRHSFKMMYLMKKYYLEHLYFSRLYFYIYKRMPPFIIRVRLCIASVFLRLSEWTSVFAISVFAAFPVDGIMAVGWGCALRHNVTLCLVISIMMTYFIRKLERAGASSCECREALVVITTYITTAAVCRNFGGAQRLYYPTYVSCLLTSVSITAMLFRLTGVGSLSIAKIIIRRNNGQLTAEEYNNLKGGLVTTALYVLLSRLFYHVRQFFRCFFGRNEQ